MSSSRSPWSKRSLTAQAMGHVDPITKAIVPPIHVTTTYIRDEDNAYSSGFVYGRPDNATVREAEEVLAMLEEAEAGALLRQLEDWLHKPQPSRDVDLAALLAPYRAVAAETVEADARRQGAGH